MVLVPTYVLRINTYGIYMIKYGLLQLESNANEVPAILMTYR